MKKYLIKLLFIVSMGLCLTACSSGEPVAYNAAYGAPYEGLYEIDRMNASTSYTYSKGESDFKVTMKWRSENENIDHAEFDDLYYLEWAYDDMTPFELREPNKDMTDLKNNTYSIKPGEDVEINIDFDSYFDEIPDGVYKFVKVFNVIYKDGTSTEMVASFTFDFDD